MDNHERGAALAKRGFELWGNGQLEEAAECYREAVPLLDPDHYWTPMAYGEYASVLAALGRNTDARAQSQRHLEIELRQDPSGRSPCVIVARYFLAENSIRCGDPEAALRAVGPCLETAGKLAAAVHVVHSEALYSLGRRDEAVRAAHLALSSSKSEEQRQKIRERFQEIFGPNWAAG